MNVLIQRLGKSSEQLTTMISCQEYAYFEWKRKVKEALKKQNISLAQELLQKKEALNGTVNAALQEQFYRYIQGILKGTCADISDLEEAIRLTHPEFSGKIEEEDLFSIQELNLLLFYAKCKMQKEAEQGRELLEVLLQYIQEHITDIQAKNQIFPRAVSIYCQEVKGNQFSEKRYLLCKEALENNVKDLPETLVLTAEYDPLRDEGEAYAKNLEEAGNHVKLHRIHGAFHGFFALGIKFLHVQESFKYINEFLNKSYEKIL